MYVYLGGDNARKRSGRTGGVSGGLQCEQNMPRHVP